MMSLHLLLLTGDSPLFPEILAHVPIDPEKDAAGTFKALTREKPRKVEKYIFELKCICMSVFSSPFNKSHVRADVS